MSLAITTLVDNDDWEVCNDDGFIYKRRRRRHLDLPEGPSPANIEAELRRQKRARKRRCLLVIREKYQREIEEWEGLSASISRLASPPELTDMTLFGTPSIASPPRSALSLPTVDDLLVEMEAQELVLKKFSDFCDCVDSFCEAQEERLTLSLIGLPIWGSPRALMRSLCS